MTRSNQHENWNSVIQRRLASTTAVGAILAVAVITGASAAQSARAQAFLHPKIWNETVLHAFTENPDGAEPKAGLIHDSQGNLYGTTQEGGNSDNGAVFKVDTSGNLTILYSFTGYADGSQPFAGLVQDAQGNLYGTTASGGNLTYCKGNGCGLVFKLDTSGNETVLYSFTGGLDGGQPMAGLVRDAAGSLYGTTTLGGNTGCQDNAGCGVVFKLDTSGNETVLHTFTGGADGATPYQGGLIRDKAGNLYGVTFWGGDLSKCAFGPGCGVVFKLDTSGNESVLYTFEGETDGAVPQGPLARDSDGNLYGVTAQGGNLTSCDGHGCGLVFKLDTSGNETALHTFSGGSDGAVPNAVIRDREGNLYGTTYSGGNLSECTEITNGGGCGVVFKVDTIGREKVLYTFTGQSDGGNPDAPVLRHSNGNLYGTTLFWGDNNCRNYGCGVVFELQK
jgi:uncharacterized repeat protein (TIGR03803 family)